MNIPVHKFGVRSITFMFGFRWDWRDMWIGVYWKRFPSAIDLFICILPCFPINIYIQWFKEFK